MIIGTFPQGIYKSADGGLSWKESNINWSMDGVFTLVTHPQNPEIVYAGTYNGINRSLDFGDHWEMWDQGMPGEQWVFSIDFDASDPEIMYACSKNGENEGTGVEGFRGTVMKSENGGEVWTEIDGFPNRDRFSLHFWNLVKASMGEDVGSFIRTSFEEIQSRTVFIVRCAKSPGPVFLKQKGFGEEFYIRIGPSSAKLGIQEALKYIDHRFERP